MPPGRRLTGAALTLAAATLALSGPGQTASAQLGADAPPAPTGGEPWFGPGLDWEQDRPADYADRLGETPSLYAQRVHYPLGEDDRRYLAQFAEASATQGAVAVLTLEPQVALTALTERDAEVLAADLADLHERLGSHFLVRFAPEMNGSWVIWGQQPDRYVAAFRTVADAVHGSAPGAGRRHAEMVWAPAYGAGYPFGRSYGAVAAAGTRIAAALDTDADGVVDDGDDPYAPYYPGDRHVDWVGLSLYDYGDRQQFGDNAAPAAGDLEARLAERFGYGVRRPRTPFIDRYASGDRPLLVETSALWNTADTSGTDELRLKRGWWRQVIAATEDHPVIGAISWLEVARAEAEIDEEVADWRATHTPALARALRADLDRSAVRLGPVTPVVDPAAATGEPAPDDPRAADDPAGTPWSWPRWAWASLALVAAGAGWWLVGRTRSRG